DAISAYRQAMALRPDFAEATGNLGAVLRQIGQTGDAIAACRRAIQLKPDFVEAYNDLGVAYYESDRLEEAIECYNRTIALNPRHSEAINNLGVAHKDRGMIKEAIACYDRVLELKPDDAAVDSNRLQTLHFLDEIDPRTAFEAHVAWAKRHAESLKQSAPPRDDDPSGVRPLKIGYVSADFRHHSVAFFLLPILENRDRAHFHVTCYSTHSRQDHVTDRLRKSADAWRDMFGIGDEDAAQRVRDDRIDILVDLAGHTAHNRLLMFARKPAPVQVTFLGYPSTTGMTAIDWRITDDIADPAGAESLHTERLFRLPRTAWCFFPLSGSPPIADRPQNEVVFGSFNNLAKITEPTLRLWGQILSQCPNSRLLIKNRASGSAAVCDRLRQALQSHGAAARQIEFLAPKESSAKHLECYNQVDIALDTFPYHGTTTTCESLWMGVPVVTRAGTAHVSRVGVSLLGSIGLNELIAGDEENYVRIAVELSRDRDRLQTLRSSLRQRMRQSPLMDAPEYARQIEAAYRMMWKSRA
ncbi:MAG TPA: tetratricopeptide repeat protein, partial [Tepidisphaeraceae bacterium]|nr:tetratricopeptide repeat protein [Tepidisphaeraceae bacterium]